MRDSLGRSVQLGRRGYIRLRRARACTQFTPTMPAQETATPTTLGSTWVAAMPVIGMPMITETMASAVWRARPLLSAASSRLASSACCRSSAAVQRPAPPLVRPSPRPRIRCIQRRAPSALPMRPRYLSAAPRLGCAGRAGTAAAPDKALSDWADRSADSCGLCWRVVLRRVVLRRDSAEAGSSGVVGSGWLALRWLVLRWLVLWRIRLWCRPLGRWLGHAQQNSARCLHPAMAFFFFFFFFFF